MPLAATLFLLAAIQSVSMPTGLTPDEQLRFLDASKSLSRGQSATALPIFKTLLQAHPGDLVVSECAAESALDMGDRTFAAATLKPLETAYPEEWMITVLLVRLYAEAGDEANRDRETAKMIEMKNAGKTPLNQYIIEKVHLTGGRTLIISNSIVPWGIYKIVNLAQLVDTENRRVMAMTLETGDADQPFFAKTHPKEAAAGGRLYSYDAYREEKPTAEGKKAQTHFTFQLLDRKPTYDEVRKEFVGIAEGTIEPVTSKVNVQEKT